MIISFCGNSNFTPTEQAEKIMLQLIKYHAEHSDSIYCYCGGYGNFDTFAADCVIKAKKHYGNIVNCLITAYLPVNNERFRHLKTRYDEIIYPPIENVPYRYAILKRNEWIADNSDLIISHTVYTIGGAGKMLEYAERKNKNIVYLNKLIKN